MSTKTYTALTPIEDAKTRTEEGGRLELSDEHAAPLLASKAVELYKPARAPRASAAPAAPAAPAALTPPADPPGGTEAQPGLLDGDTPPAE